ncbi:MAG: hypothetical protein V3S49_00650 [Thermodesulfobacteriota bacterium]
MEETIKIINEVEKKGLVRKYAIGGGIATIFYVEPILTYDLDIFFIPTKEEKELTPLSSIYDYLKRKGYRLDKEHIIIAGIPVQFIPVYNELIKEAVENAIDHKYKKTETRILKAEYLIAIMLQTFRAKDKEKIIKFIDEARIENKSLTDILKRHGLIEKFERFMRLYYEK